jgi:hypothetical protein
MIAVGTARTAAAHPGKAAPPCPWWRRPLAAERALRAVLRDAHVEELRRAAEQLRLRR